MNRQKYTLVDGLPVVEPDLMKWAAWYETADRLVELTTVGESRISTVFLSLPRPMSSKLLLYQTLVMGGELDGECEDYETVEQARAGHARMVERVRASETE